LHPRWGAEWRGLSLWQPTLHQRWGAERDGLLLWLQTLHPAGVPQNVTLQFFWTLPFSHGMTQTVLPEYKNCHAMENRFGQVLLPCQFARLFWCGFE